jgi:uncharacterized phiE125 gp8 family phage protein
MQTLHFRAVGRIAPTDHPHILENFPMMMVELTSIPTASLPVAELGHYLRLATGFADDGSEDAPLESCLRAAISAIESRIGKVLFERRFSMQVSQWQSGSAHKFPMAPISEIESVTLVNRAGQDSLLDPARYALRQDGDRPAVISIGPALPQPSLGGHIDVILRAGFGPNWADIPADLRQAVLIMAADFYDGSGREKGDISFAVAMLIEPYRPLRIGVRP